MDINNSKTGQELESMPDRLGGQIKTLNSLYLLLSCDLIVHKKNQIDLMLVEIRDKILWLKQKRYQSCY